MSLTLVTRASLGQNLMHPLWTFVKSWMSPRKSPPGLQTCDFSCAQGDPKICITSVKQDYVSGAVLAQSCIVASSKYMDISTIRKRLVEASANLDHLLKEVTAVGRPKNKP